MRSLATQPAPAWLRELADGRANYEELLGWPVSLNVRQGTLVVAIGSVVGAVSMPAALGARVQHELQIAMLCGPVIADPGGSRWTFLTRPVADIRSAVVTELAHWQVHLVGRGGLVPIPLSVSLSDGNSWRWAEQPAPNRPLPPTSAVVCVSRRLTATEYLAQGA
jgi:hypothetical protein